MNPEDFFTIIAAFPSLPGAACKGKAPVMDADDGQEAAALALCARCGALQACRQWFYGLPPRDRPEGVVAGLIHRRDGRGNHSRITEGAAQ